MENPTDQRFQLLYLINAKNGLAPKPRHPCRSSTGCCSTSDCHRIVQPLRNILKTCQGKYLPTFWEHCFARSCYNVAVTIDAYARGANHAFYREHLIDAI